MNEFSNYLRSEKLIVAMIHVQATPCSPKNKLSPKEIIDAALNEAALYYEAGIKCVMIENMHDVPYLNKEVGPEVPSLLSLIGHEIKKKSNLFCGVQILAAANKEALAAAHCGGLDFIRAEGFVYGHIGDEGYIDSQAGGLLRYRKTLGAENVLIFTDIKKKHSSHSITNDLSIVDHAKACEFFLSDGLIITGRHTGECADLDEVNTVKKNTKLPLFIGSGINENNIGSYYHLADGFIVGSCFKQDGNWRNPPDRNKVENFVTKFNGIK